MTDTTQHDRHDRRASDRANEIKLQATLDAAILDEDDPSKRANLMVLTEIYRGLVANNQATHELAQDVSELKNNFEAHTVKFDAHAKHEEALINKGRGAWYALAWFLGIIQVVIGYVIVDTRETIREVQVAANEARISDQRILTRIEVLEATKRFGATQ